VVEFLIPRHLLPLCAHERFKRSAFSIEFEGIIQAENDILSNTALVPVLVRRVPIFFCL